MPSFKPIDRAAVSALVRGIAALAAGISLDRTSDPRRTLPAIPPAHLWRILPRILDAAARLGDDLNAGDSTEREFMRNVASEIATGGRRVAGGAG